MAGKPRSKPPGRRRPTDPNQLTRVEALFVLKLLALDNVTEAYIQAGHPNCTRDSAAANGQRLLRKDRVKRAVEEHRARHLAEAEIDVSEAMLVLARTLRADIGLLYDERGYLKPIATWPVEVRTVVKSVEDRDHGRAKVVMYDKLAAAMRVAEHHGKLGRKVELDASESLYKLLADIEGED
jgi:phage terminase small subunit